MRRETTVLCSLLGMLLVAEVSVAQNESSLLGRWDLEVHRTQDHQASWMEVSKANGSLRVTFVGPVGEAAEGTQVTLQNGTLRFLVPKDPNEGRDLDTRYDVHSVTGGLVGSLHTMNGNTAWLTGERAPTYTPREDVRWSEPLNLFDGKDLNGWHFSDSKHSNWVVRDSTFRTTGHGADLISDGKFLDFKLHIEFNSGPHSNSGVYLRGRYEVQIETDSASEKASHHTGGVYGFLEPQPEQPREENVWQTFDVVFVGRTLTVVQNGITVIDHKDVPGITGGALDSREGEAGPVYLQGSEGGTTIFRRVILTPAAPKQ